jgi:ketosteroid isomerase-like protein
MRESNVELVRRGWEAAPKGDLETIGELVQWHGGEPSEGSCHNRTEALAFMRQRRFMRSGPPELVDGLGAGDKVVLITRGTGEDGEPELSANLTTFRDGKVIEMVHYADPDDARAAAGLA